MKLPLQWGYDGHAYELRDSLGRVVASGNDGEALAFLQGAGNAFADLQRAACVAGPALKALLGDEKCDHSVGICYCDVLGAIDMCAEAAAGALKVKPVIRGTVPEVPGFYWFRDDESMFRVVPVEVIKDPEGGLFFYHPQPARREGRPMEPRQDVANWRWSFFGPCGMEPMLLD
jgi:hypothetical protein